MVDGATKLDTLKQICAEEHRRMDTTDSEPQPQVPSPRTQTAVSSLAQLSSAPNPGTVSSDNSVNPLRAAIATSATVGMASSSQLIGSPYTYAGNVNPLAASLNPQVANADLGVIGNESKDNPLTSQAVSSVMQQALNKAGYSSTSS
jgi:hypothetical protein